MYQAGIKKITLYENKGIEFYHFNPLNVRDISLITGQGNIVEIENLQRPDFEIDYKLSTSGKVLNTYLLKLFILGLTQENENQLNQIISSVYGWCPLIEYLDGTYKYYDTPLFCDGSKIKPNREMSFEIELKTATGTTKKYYDYTPGISPVTVYRADTTLITADSTLITADYAL